MAVTDGYLRAGADVLAGRLVTDGLLVLLEPTGGAGPPPFLSSSGTNVSSATHAGVASVLDAGTNAAATTHAGVASVADAGTTTSTADHSGTFQTTGVAYVQGQPGFIVAPADPGGARYLAGNVTPVGARGTGRSGTHRAARRGAPGRPGRHTLPGPNPNAPAPGTRTGKPGTRTPGSPGNINRTPPGTHR